MLLDAELLFSDKQVVTATADSTNTVDLGKGTGRNMNPRLRVFAQCTNTPAGITSINVALKGSVDGTTFTTVAAKETLAAGLVPGAQLLGDVPYLTDASFRFYKMAYTVTGTATTGAKLTAGLVADGTPIVELTH